MIGGDEPKTVSSEEESNVATSGPLAGELTGEPDKTLQDARFVIGDYVSCAVFAPLADGGIAPPSSMLAGPGGRMRGREMGDFGGGRGGVLGGPRENGFGGFRVRGGGAFGNGGRLGDGGLPSGEWRRGERVPDRYMANDAPGRGTIKRRI